VGAEKARQRIAPADASVQARQRERKNSLKRSRLFHKPASGYRFQISRDGSRSLNLLVSVRMTTFRNVRDSEQN
jgi:hypothetical protein